MQRLFRLTLFIVLLSASSSVNPLPASATEVLYGVTYADISDSITVLTIDPSTGSCTPIGRFKIAPPSKFITSLAYHPPTHSLVAMHVDLNNPARLIVISLSTMTMTESAVTGLPAGQEYAQGIEYDLLGHRLLVTFGPISAYTQNRIAEISLSGAVNQVSPPLPVADRDFLVRAPDGRILAFDPNEASLRLAELVNIFTAPALVAFANPPLNINVADPAYSCESNALFATRVDTKELVRVEASGYPVVGSMAPYDVSSLAFSTDYACEPTPALQRTWGHLKVRYR